MSSIDANTNVVIPMKHLVALGFGIVATTVLACWGLLSWSASGLRDDVKEIRNTVTANDKAGAKALFDAQTALSGQIGQLNITLMGFNQKMDTYAASLNAATQKVEGMTKSVDVLATRLDGIEKRIPSTQASWNVQPIIDAINKTAGSNDRLIIVPTFTDKLQLPPDKEPK